MIVFGREVSYREEAPRINIARLQGLLLETADSDERRNIPRRLPLPSRRRDHFSP
jgi:hypothetical protein